MQQLFNLPKAIEEMKAVEHRFVVAAVIRRHEEILLIRQRGPHDPAAYWAIPGGRVEPGEAITAAVGREVWEETGLRTDRLGQLAYAAWIEEEARQIRRTTALVYEVTAWTGELCVADPDGLVLEAAFVPLAVALEQLQALPFPAMREPLMAYLRGQATGSVWFYTPGTAPVCISPAEATPWQDLAYLTVGTPRQQAAHACLESLAVPLHLAPYSPVLIGTLPLAIDTAQSDLDVACFAPDLAAFVGAIRGRYATMPGYRLKEHEVRGVPTVIAEFTGRGFDLQIFAQPQPVLAQYGFRHLVVESRLLALGGDQARRAIHQLKQSGLKTEPAFAHYFGLAGDPYERLWALSLAGDPDLRAAVVVS